MSGVITDVYGNTGSFFSPNYPSKYDSGASITYTAHLASSGPLVLRLFMDYDIDGKVRMIVINQERFQKTQITPPRNQGVVIFSLHFSKPFMSGYDTMIMKCHTKSKNVNTQYINLNRFSTFLIND